MKEAHTGVSKDWSARTGRRSRHVRCSVSSWMKKVAWLLTAAAALACTSRVVQVVEEPDDTRDGGFDSSPPADSGLGVLAFSPDVAYSGFDGTHAFKVPIAVYDSAADLTVTADDATAATIAPVELATKVKDDGTVDNGKYYMVDVKKAGTITLTARSNGKTATARITVASYDPSRWTAGQTRYDNAAGSDPPCTMCHAGGNAIDHSPAAMASSTDEAIAAVITTGIATSGFPISGVQGGHRWNVTQTERDGLVTYLRALDPRGFK